MRGYVPLKDQCHRIMLHNGHQKRRAVAASFVGALDPPADLSALLLIGNQVAFPILVAIEDDCVPEEDGGAAKTMF